MRALLPTLLLIAVTCAEAAVNPATGQPEKGVTGETLTGQPLRELDWPDATRRRLELDLEIAKAVFDVAPEREESWFWLGRRYGYLGWYADAIDVFTAGLERFPESYKLHRFRGRHRARSRDFSGAIEDYRAGIEKMQGHADTFEPDGIPNARRQPISTYRSNLHYYLGQTAFATGDYETMLIELDRSLDSPIAMDIDDHRIAVAFWKYLALRKLGRDEAAARLLESLPDEPLLIENETYHKAVRVFADPEAADLAAQSGDSLARFALGMKQVFAGRYDEARRTLEAVVAANALGYWPAEAELVRAPLD